MRNVMLILLLFSFFASPKGSAAGDYCPDAPPPRLHIGERGEVAPGIDRLYLRMLPAVGTGEVGLLYGSNQFEVLAGPSCNGGYSWWRVELDGGVRGWVAEGTWSEYYLRPLDGGICSIAERPWQQILATLTCVMLGLEY